MFSLVSFTTTIQTPTTISVSPLEGDFGCNTFLDLVEHENQRGIFDQNMDLPLFTSIISGPTTDHEVTGLICLFTSGNPSFHELSRLSLVVSDPPSSWFVQVFRRFRHRDPGRPPPVLFHPRTCHNSSLRTLSWTMSSLTSYQGLCSVCSPSIHLFHQCSVPFTTQVFKQSSLNEIDEVESGITHVRI